MGNNEFYAKTHLIAKCYGNEYVLTIKEKNVYRDNNLLLIRSTDERVSCFSRSSTFQKTTKVVYQIGDDIFYIYV